MEHATTAKGNRRQPAAGQFQSLAQRDGRDAVRSPDKNSAPKKAAARRAKPARSPRKEMVKKSRADKVVCRYCGSADLAPSFIKRRDRRCRKCFSKRYGSAARPMKPKVRK